jgi:hypothetical protein
LQKVTITFVMSVCLSPVHPSVCLSSCKEQLSNHNGFSLKFMRQCGKVWYNQKGHRQQKIQCMCTTSWITKGQDTFRLCTTDCFSTATMVMWMCLFVKLYVLYLSCSPDASKSKFTKCSLSYVALPMVIGTWHWQHTYFVSIRLNGVYNACITRRLYLLIHPKFSCLKLITDLWWNMAPEIYISSYHINWILPWVWYFWEACLPVLLAASC